MKTPEEIKQSVLKECAERCPQFGDKYEDGIIELYQSFQGNPGYLLALGGKLWRLMIDAKDNADSPIWQLAYRLLNMEGRELEELAKGLVGALKNANLAIIDVLQHGDSSDKLRIAHKINSEALYQWKGGGK